MPNLKLTIKKSDINEKVSLLRDFCILKKEDKETEKAVKTLLKQCKTELKATIVLHDVLQGRETLQQLLKRKGIVVL